MPVPLKTPEQVHASPTTMQLVSMEIIPPPFRIAASAGSGLS